MKAILLVRVSTVQQNYDAQEIDLINYASKLGYNNSDIIIIAEKESGIKLKEAERKGINEMKELIEQGDIERVIIWELSRLSRRSSDLYNLRDYFQEKKVQLTCFKPDFNLLNEDFSINSNANLIFSVFGTISENEMILKKERFKRSKIRNAQTGKFSGGIPKKGYKIDDNGYYIIDEKEAEIIRLVFDLYVNERLSIQKIKEELFKRGIDTSYTSIRYILRDKSYCGVPYKHRKGNLERVFPEIIPLHIFEEARKIALSNRISPKITFNNNDYLASKILKCPICGHSMSPKTKNCLYYCVLHQYPYTSQSKSCTNKCTVRADVLDSLLWQTARQLYIDSLNKKNEDEIKDLYKRQEEYSSKINVAQKNLEDYNQRYEDNENAYILRDISQASYNSNKKKLSSKRKELELEIIEWKNNLDLITKQFEILDPSNKLSQKQREEAVRAVYNITDKKRMLQIVRLYIKTVKVYYESDIIKRERELDKEFDYSTLNIHDDGKIRKDKIFEIELYNGIKRYYRQQVFKNELRRIYLAPRTEKGYEDVEDLVDFHYHYVEMHQTQKHYLEQRAKKEKDNDN